MADTPNGETANQSEAKNDSNNTGTGNGNASEQAENERLRKEAEQARMRANQLENELKAKREAEEAAERKRLEEKEEWKTVAEQEKAKREALETERKEAELKAEMSKTETSIFGDFPTEVTELAKEMGLGLTSTTDEGQQKLRSSLEKLSERVANNGKIRPNNGNNRQQSETREDIIQDFAKTNDPTRFDEALSGLSWINQAKALNGDS